MPLYAYYDVYHHEAWRRVLRGACSTQCRDDMSAAVLMRHATRAIFSRLRCPRRLLRCRLLIRHARLTRMLPLLRYCACHERFDAARESGRCSANGVRCERDKRAAAPRPMRCAAQRSARC